MEKSENIEKLLDEIVKTTVTEETITILLYFSLEYYITKHTTTKGYKGRLDYKVIFDTMKQDTEGLYW